jgi:hypothetical protein
MEFLLAHISRSSPLRARLVITLQEGVGKHRETHD